MTSAAGQPQFIAHPHPQQSTGQTPGQTPGLRVGVLVVAYNAASTLANTLSRLPNSFVEAVDHVLVCDDASTDGTYEVGLQFKNGSTLPLTVVRHQRNLGYGGNQKTGYALGRRTRPRRGRPPPR